jgi:hypothetical protein
MMARRVQKDGGPGGGNRRASMTPTNARQRWEFRSMQMLARTVPAVIEHGGGVF